MNHDYDWVREPPGDYQIDDPDPGYDDILDRPDADVLMHVGGVTVRWDAGAEGFVVHDGEVIARADNC
jgi:hypothetical protein